MKTTNTKKLLALLGLVILFTDLSAQNDSAHKKEISSELMRSTYIFEGKVFSYKGYTIKINGINVNSNSYLIEVDKVIKGNIRKGTINLVKSEPLSFDYHSILPGEGIYF